jgi:hypothetical protein
LVEDITMPGGVRAAPPAAKLQEFGSRAAAMDGEMLASMLLDKIAGDDVQARIVRPPAPVWCRASLMLPCPRRKRCLRVSSC